MYNVVCLLLVYTDFYAKIYPVLEVVDIPFYIGGAVVFFRAWHFRFKGMSKLQKYCFIACLFYLIFKMVDMNYPFTNHLFIFWNVIIIGTPFLLVAIFKEENE